MLSNKSFKAKALLVLKGFCMGTADVIPGVSGGTMAFILGIYNELIYAIKSFDRKWILSIIRLDKKGIFTLPHFPFLIPLFAGIFLALLFFTRIIPLPELLLKYPEQIYGLFFGLIAGSIVLLIQDMVTIGVKIILPLLAGIVFGTVVFNLVPTQTPETSWFVFLCGGLAICAMILPGISGSFILLILNKYAYIFNAIGYFKLSILIPFALGAVTGLVIFSRLLSYLLRRFYRSSILAIIGILIASLWVIWPFQQRLYETVRGKPRLIETTPMLPPDLSTPVLVTIAMTIVGFLIVFLINWFAIIKKERAD